MQRMLFVAVVASALLSLTPTQVGAQGRVLSLTGRASANGVVLEAEGPIPARAKLTLGPKATLQALFGDSFHLALVGPAMVELRPRALRLRRARALEVSAATGRIELPGGHTVILGPAASTMRYESGTVQVAWGELTLERACPPPATTQPTTTPVDSPNSQPAPCAESRATLRRGARISLDTTSAGPRGSISNELLRYQPPPPWTPPLTPTVDDLESVQQWVAAKRERQQELAACGCTEGTSGGAASTNPQQGSISAIESNTATLWISIKGLPPRATP